MAACSCLRSMFEFETNKVVRIYSVWYGSLKSTIHFMVFLYVSIVLLTDRRYQKKDSVISSMHVKVKGVSQTEKRVWDTAEYTIPGQGVNSFFVLTNIIMTENQAQRLCPEFPFAKAVCTTDKSCMKGQVDPQGNGKRGSFSPSPLEIPFRRNVWPPGIQTGKCVKYNRTINTCEVSAWCPVESTKAAPTPAILDSAENFTVLIKNNIHFPKFDFTATNIPLEFNTSCTYNKHKAPLCPIFRLRDILQEAGEKFSEVAVQGGIIGIEINWDCNLDKWGHRCSPNYGFRRLDDKRANEALFPGYNFRFARYYKQPDGTEERTLIKAYGIRFDILIFGTAGKFDFIEMVVYIGSVLSYFGLAQLAVDCLLTSPTSCCCKPDPVKEYYYNKKCQEVLGPRCTLFYVTFVDEPGILMIDKLSETSLQTNEGGIIDKHQGDFMPSSQLPYWDRTISPPNPEELQLLQIRREGPCERPSWCCCGKCRPADPIWERLCCRKTDGPCITTSPLFVQLVLSEPMLKFVLLYKDPLLDVADAGRKPFRHCAYEQYIRWRFGEGDLGARAVIPNCCRWRIRDAFPSKDGEYRGFGKKK